MNWLRKYFRKREGVDLEESAINRDFFDDLERLTGEHFGVADKVDIRKYINEHFKGRGIPIESYSFVCKKSSLGYLEELGYDFSAGDGRINNWKKMEGAIYENYLDFYNEKFKLSKK